MTDRVPMTPRGYKALQDELQHIKSVDRPQNVCDIEEARAHGDLSENAEYHAAKERQGHIVGRMHMVDDKLARAQVIDPAEQEGDTVLFGAKVVLLDTENNEEVTYTIVGDDEADISQNMISISSPIARALIGKSVDDTVAVRVPKGAREFEIIEVTFG